MHEACACQINPGVNGRATALEMGIRRSACSSSCEVNGNEEWTVLPQGLQWSRPDFGFEPALVVVWDKND